MIAAAALLLAVAQGRAAEPAPMPAAEALALFDRVCIRPYPDPQGFAAALAAEPERFRKDTTPFAYDGSTGRYLGPRAEIVYSAADGVAPALPTRQCGVLVRTPGFEDHDALAATLRARYGLGQGETQGDARRATSWTMPEPGGSRRYLLTTRPDGDDTLLSVAVMKLETGR